MVFGESVLNDAVAIVLTRTLLSFNDEEADGGTGARIVRAIAVFALDFASSLVLGAAFGAASAVTLRRLDIRSSTCGDDAGLYVVLRSPLPSPSPAPPPSAQV